MTVFVVDDDEAVRRSIVFLLVAAGFSVHSFASGEELLAACDDGSRGCVLLDVDMPGMDGITIAEMLRARGSKLAILLMTGGNVARAEARAHDLGLRPILQKPLLANVLLRAVRDVLARLPD
ncbi:response regulator transcription factor [Benzoatithermus flavus]|uniref:Response regulator n=1 Tax=Benzoatithermus flavus TaxID=3108223 RepID=A0ABU8XX16_9PROT